MSPSRLTAFAAASLAACGGASPGATQPRIRNASVIALPDSPWEGVFVDGATFALRAGDPAGLDEPATLTGTVDELRQVGSARVARLRWTYAAPGGSPRPSPAGPHYLVENTRGIAFLLQELPDVEIAVLLDQPDFWMFPHPTVDHPVDGPSGETASATVNDGELTACYSIEMPACGTGGCSSDVCVSSAGGIVSLGGQWAPAGKLFTAE
jgi:hypothetical protein